MATSRTHRSLICAVALMTGLTSCAVAPSAQSDRLSVPTMEIPNGTRIPGQSVTLVDLEVGESEACPVAEIGGNQGLLVSPTGSYALREEKALVVNGKQVQLAQSFETISPHVLEQGFECGGKNWDVGFRLVTESISVSGSVATWTQPEPLPDPASLSAAFRSRP